MSSLRIATWNVSWSNTESKRSERSRKRIEELGADILVLTETTSDLIPEGGYFAKGGPDWGYELKPDRRKVVLWSRWPISDVTAEITDPGGRHVRATVETPLGPVRVHGVCVPWSRAHVSGGNENRKLWQDYLSYLKELKVLLRRESGDPLTRELPLIVAGVVNHREQPGARGNRKASDTWSELLADASLSSVTDQTMINRIEISTSLTATDSKIFPPVKMSDDQAVSCLVTGTTVT